MPNRSSNLRKRASDANQVAKSIVELATGEIDKVPLTSEGKNAAAVALGRLGGLKGGKARAIKLSSTRRSAIARKAALSRWKKDGGKGANAR